MAGMLIRRLGLSDLDRLLELYAHLHSTDSSLPARPLVEAVWQELITGDANRCLGGFVDEAMVCSCTLSIVPNLTRGCRPYGLIENVVTHESHRRKGYGKAILAEALREAWAGNC